MAAGENWTIQEVRAAVLDYMAMYKSELAGQPYNKTAHRKSLLTKLAGRSDGAVELKHQNISAVLRDMGYFWIPGYKPRSNYQSILIDEVSHWIDTNPELDRHALAAAEAPATTPELFDFGSFKITDRPTRRQKQLVVEEGRQAPYDEPRLVGFKRDYAEREARNSSLGRAGEELVVKFEQHQLAAAGFGRLAEKVEHVSKTRGDGIGFDVLSFDASGGERFIEVKTTAFAKETPFFVSSSELRFAERNTDRYALYRLFEFKKAPKCYALHGMIQNHCALDPISYRCSFG